MERFIGKTPWVIDLIERQVRSPTLKTISTQLSEAADPRTGKIRAPFRGEADAALRIWRGFWKGSVKRKRRGSGDVPSPVTRLWGARDLLFGFPSRFALVCARQIR
jgi:hypothetical protein